MAYQSKYAGKEIDEAIDAFKQGGNATDNNYTDADKALVQTIPNINDELNTKADKEGYYPTMTVGKSDNLVGRGESTPEEFSFRPSAGYLSVEDGSARITSIKGDSVVWNQKLHNADFSSGSDYWSSHDASLIEKDGYIQFVVNEQSSQYISQFGVNLPKNHIYVVECDFQRDTNESFPFLAYFGKKSGGYDTYYSESYSNNTRHTHTAFITTTDEIEFILVYPIINASKGVSANIYSITVSDLTQMFGAGSVPTTIEEYNARKPLVANEFAYNEGEVVSMNVDSIKSVGNNAFDYTKGYAKVVGGHEYHCTVDGAPADDVYFSKDIENITFEENVLPHKINGIYTFPSDGYVSASSFGSSNENICICLHHSYDKPFMPYEDDVVDLSWIKGIKYLNNDDEYVALFPNGLRSAGEAHDEVRYNRTTKKWEAIKRVGEVDMGSMDWIMGSSSQSNIVNPVSTSINDVIVAPNRNDEKANILCPLYVTDSLDNTYLLKIDKSIGAGSSGLLRIYDSQYQNSGSLESFRTAIQGVMLYYELAKPIVVEIPNSENFNLDYLVWDFGTEEAKLIVPSAPFRADIIYQFNAVDRIRDNSRRVADLESIVYQLQSQLAALVASPIDESAMYSTPTQGED